MPHELNPADNRLDALIVQALSEESGKNGITEMTTFDDLDIESLTFAEVLMRIEDETGQSLQLENDIELPDGAVVADLIATVKQRLGES